MTGGSLANMSASILRKSTTLDLCLNQLIIPSTDANVPPKLPSILQGMDGISCRLKGSHAAQVE